MLLLREQVEEIKVIKEATGDSKNYWIEGVFLQYDTVNRNNRIYPAAVMREAVNTYVEDYVKKNRALGELGHPEGPTINLDRVSHMVKEIKDTGKKTYIGKAKILGTPNGKIVQNLLDEGATIGVSSRAVGSTKKFNGIDEVQNDFKIAAIADIVADPSAPDAFVRGIMENKEWVYVDGTFMEKDIMEAKAAIKNTAMRNLEEAAITEFKKFLKAISK